MKKKRIQVHPSNREGCRKTFLFMQQMLILLFVFNLDLSASVISQNHRLSLNLKNVGIEEFISAIKQQCDVGFLYDYGKIKDVTSITIQAKDETLPVVLDKALKGTGLVAEVQDNIIVVRKAEQAALPQALQILKGNVRDQSGEALPGVAILIKGTSIGVTTDGKGDFALSLPDFSDKTLIFSFLGMKSREIPVRDYSQFMKVVLEEDEYALQEAVVTGIYTRNKESFTGAATTYSKKDLKMIGTQNIIQSLKTLDPAMMVLESKLNGSNPNKMPDIEIRGKTSIIGLKSEYETDPNQPLFILDGVETTLESIINLNMDRVASVTILKDAASTAIYGSKAANGVIVVETVQPQAGQLRVSYNGNFGVQFADLSDYNLMNSAEKLEFEKLSNRYNAFGEYGAQIAKDNIYFKRLAEIKRGVDTYWMNEPLRTVFNHSHSIYADGGDDAMRYGLGINYNDNGGVMKGSDRKIMGGNIDLRYRKGKLIFSNKFSFDMTNTGNEPVSFNEFARANPYYRKEDADGNVPLYLEFKKDDDIAIINPLYKWNIMNIQEGRNISLRDNFNVEWTIIPSLRAVGRFSVTKGVNKTTKFKSPKHPDYIGTDPLKQGSYSYNMSETFSYNGDANVTFGKLFAEMHQVNIVAGMSFNENNSEANGYSVAGFNNDYHTNPAFSTGFTDKQKPMYSQTISRSAAFFVNGNYSFKNRYLMDVNYRSDGTSVFGANKRFSTTWSVGLAWNLHNEIFIKNLGWINNLKIRGSVGNPGNQNFDAYQAMKTYRYNVDQTNMFGTSAIVDKFGNKNLDWQRTIDKNIGMDVSVLDGNLRLTVDYYHKDTDPLLISISMPPSLGTTSIYTNLGGQLSTGFNASVNYTFLRRKETNWSVNLNTRTGKSKYRNIGNDLAYLNELGSATNLTRYYEGANPDDMWAVRSLGIDPATGREVFLKKDGTQTFSHSASDEVVVGNTRPDMEGVIGSSFYYKGFSASINFRYRIGGQVQASALLKKVENISESELYYNQDKRALYDRWKQPGDKAKFKSITNQDNTPMSSRFIETENTFSGESISIGYESSGKWVRSFGAQGVTFRAYMNEIFRISSFKEERGIDYPFARNISFSLSLRF